MKKIRLLIYALLTMALIFGLDACGDDFDTNDSSDGGTYLVVGNASVARSTISPDAPDLSKLSALVLKGTLTSEDGAAEKTLATADKFADLSGKRISIRTGTWSFTLSAELGGVKFSGTKEDVSIEAGTTNTVAFELVAENNAGGMSVTVQFPKDENVTKVKATLSKPGDSSFEAKTQEFKKTNALGESDFALVQGESGAAGSIEKYAVTYSRSISDGNEALADGTYYLVFDFYADGTGDETALNTADYIVRVVRGLVTAATETVSLNETYTIAYAYYANGTEMDEEAALGVALAESAAGYVLPGKFSRKSSTITLPDLAKDGYLWQGWYEDAAFTKSVKEIPAGSTGSRNLYAAFINAVTVSKNGNADANVLSGEAVGSVKAAVEKIIGFAANSIDWTIYVDGTLTGAQKIGPSVDGKAKSITLEGKNGYDDYGSLQDVLDGNEDSDIQYTLCVATTVPVTITNLKITNGLTGLHAGYDSEKGQKVECDVTLVSGCLITENSGPGVYLEAGKVTLADGSITKNKNEQGAGVYVEGGTFIVKSGTLSENEATVFVNGIYVGESGALKISEGAYIYDDVFLSEGTLLTIAGALSEESTVVTITPASYDTTTQWVVLEEGANTTLGAECGKIAVASDGTNDWRINEEGYLQQLADIDGVVSQITSMTNSDTISVSGYMVQDDLVTIVNAMKELCPEYSSVAPDIIIKLDLSNTTGLTKLSGEFREVWNLGELVLPEGITTISAVGERTDYLATMNIPASVTKIDDGAFYRSCASLTIAEGNTSYKIVNKALYTADLTKLVAYANKGDENGSCEVLASATEIAPWAFSFAKKLKTLTFATGHSFMVSKFPTVPKLWSIMWVPEPAAQSTMPLRFA